MSGEEKRLNRFNFLVRLLKLLVLNAGTDDASRV